MPTPVDGAQASKKRRPFDAFISYSHRSDEQLGPQFERALEQLAKRWSQRKALNVFFDGSDLGANTGLGSKLHKSLDNSEWFVFFASPESAESPWCNEEVKYWLDHQSSKRMLIVHTGGELNWTTNGDHVDWDRSTAAPSALRGRLEEEPTHIDMRWAHDQKGLDIRRHPQFRADVTKVAAPIHGKSSPQDLDSQDLREYLLSRRLRRLAIGALVLLTVLAVVAALLAHDRQLEADRQAKRSASRALASEGLSHADSERDLSLLQALESLRVADTTDAWGSLLTILGQPSRFQQRSSDAHCTPAAGTTAAPKICQPVTAITLSADGRLAATGDASGAVVVWDVDPEAVILPATRKPYTLSPLPGPVQLLTISAQDGAQVLEGVSSDGTFARWDVVTGERVDGTETPDVLGTTAISNESGFVAGTADTNGDGTGDVVRLYTPDLTLDAPLTGEGLVEHLGFRPGTGELAWSQGNEAYVWDVLTASDSRRLPIPFVSEITSIAFSPDGVTMAIGEEDGPIRLIRLGDPDSEAAPSEVLPAPTSAAVALSFAPSGSADDVDGVALASAHRNGEVKVWRVFGTDGFLDDTLLGHKEETTALAFGEGGQIVSGSFDGQALWWSATPIVGLGERLPGSGASHDADVMEVAFADREGTTIVSLDRDGLVIVTDETTGVGETVPGSELGPVTHLDASKDVLASTSDDGSIEIVTGLVSDQGETFLLSGEHDSPIRLLDLADDGAGLVTVADNVVVWDLGSKAVRSRPELPSGFRPYSVLYGRSSVWIGGRDTDGAVVYEFDAATGNVRHEGIRHGGSQIDGVAALALSPDGRTLATGGSDRRIRLWDAGSHGPRKKRTGNQSNTLEGHREQVSGLAFTHDGESLISVDRDLVVDYWDVSDRRLTATLGGPTDGINDLAVSEDGSMLAVASDDDTVSAWTLDKRRWITVACLFAGRNLTPDEWVRYGHGPQQKLCPDYPGSGEPVDWTDRLGD